MNDVDELCDKVYHTINTLRALVDGMGITLEDVEKVIEVADRMELEIPYYTPKDAERCNRALHHIRTRLNLVKHALVVIEAEHKVKPEDVIDFAQCERSVALYYDVHDYRDRIVQAGVNPHGQPV